MSYGREFRPVQIEDTIFDDSVKSAVLDELKGNKRLFIFGEYSTGKTTLSRVVIRRYMEDGILGNIERRMWDKFCKKGSIDWNPNVHIINCSKFKSVGDLKDYLLSINDARDRLIGDKGKEAFLVLHLEVLDLDSQLLLEDYLKKYVKDNALVVMVSNICDDLNCDLLDGFRVIGLERFHDYQILGCLKSVCDSLNIDYTEEVLQYIIDKSCHTLKISLIALDYVTSGGDLSYKRVVNLLSDNENE